VRQSVRRRHIVPRLSGRPGGRAHGVGVRLEQKTARRQVPSPAAGRHVGEHEHTGWTDGQHVQAVRYGVRETVLKKQGEEEEGSDDVFTFFNNERSLFITRQFAMTVFFFKPKS